MDKLRKIAETLWNLKERVVFAIMLAVFGYYAYVGIFKADADLKKTSSHRAPGRELPPEGLEDIQRIEPPPPRLAEDWAAIYTPNPFWYQGGSSQPSGTTASSGATKGEAAAGVKLLRITAGRAQLQADGGSPQWASDGDTVQGFQVTKIDADKQTCEVFSEKAGKVFTLRVGGG